jgi:hypothetical protein
MSIDVITESLVTLGEAVLQPVGDRDSWGGLSGMMSRPLGRHDVSSKGGEGYSPSPPFAPRFVSRGRRAGNLAELRWVCRSAVSISFCQSFFSLQNRSSGVRLNAHFSGMEDPLSQHVTIKEWPCHSATT